MWSLFFLDISLFVSIISRTKALYCECGIGDVTGDVIGDVIGDANCVYNSFAKKSNELKYSNKAWGKFLSNGQEFKQDL